MITGRHPEAPSYEFSFRSMAGQWTHGAMPLGKDISASLSAFPFFSANSRRVPWQRHTEDWSQRKGSFGLGAGSVLDGKVVKISLKEFSNGPLAVVRFGTTVGSG